MPIEIPPERMQAIEQIGYGLNGDIGGLRKRTYYTPDGRSIRAIPSMITFSIIKEGKAIGSDIRDANLDKGWLLTAPAKPKLPCQACDKWHDTKAEVETCRRKQQKFEDTASRKAKREEINKTSSLESKVAALTAKVEKLLEVQNRQVLQPALTESPQVPRKERIRSTKKGI